MATSPWKITVSRASEASDIEKCLKIRNEVFVIEQGIAADVEHDTQDRTAVHFLALTDDQPAGAARVLIQNDQSARIGRLAVLPSKRGLGIGAMLMMAIEEAPELAQIKNFLLHAQLHAVPFYQHMGYEPYGEEFVSEAGKRARHMKKRNPASPTL